MNAFYEGFFSIFCFSFPIITIFKKQLKIQMIFHDFFL